MPPRPALVVGEDMLAPLGLEPLGFFAGWAAAGCDPARMGIGPVPAVGRLFARTGLDWDDLDLVEVNEAFAVQVLAVMRGWGFADHARINVNGSGISLGHPIGATGVRIMVTALHELRRRGGRRVLETMCIGGGQGSRGGVRGAMIGHVLDAFRPGATIYLPGATGEILALADALATDPQRMAGVHLVSCLLPGMNGTDYAALAADARITTFMLPPALRASFAAEG